VTAPQDQTAGATDSGTPVEAGRPGGGRDRRVARVRLLLAGVGAAAFGVLSFIHALDNEFVYDDWPIVVHNPTVHVPAGANPGPWYRFWREAYWPIGVSQDKLYRPLTIWSFRANVVLAGGGAPDPRAFHLVNLGIHALACVAVVLLAARLTGRVAAGALAGMLFAAHPVHAEAVVTAYGRSELMAGCFAAWVLARCVRPPDPDRPPTVLSHGLNALLLLAAVMSKEHAAFVWPVLILIDLWHKRRRPELRAMPPREWLNRVLAPSHIGFVLAITTFMLLRFSVFGWKWRMENARTRIWEDPMAHVGLIEHVLTPFRLLWLTLVNLVWPPNLCPIWSYPALSPADHLAPDVIAGMVLAMLLLLLIGLLWRWRNLCGALLAGSLVTLAIPIQALPLAHWFYAERWLYLPTVLIAALVGACVCRWGRAASIAGITLAIVLLPQSWQYAGKFADNITLQREAIRRQPDNFHARRNLASVYYFQGQYDEAIQVARQLIERFEPVSDAYLVLLKSYLELGDGRRALEAIDQYESLRRDFPEPSLSEDRQRAEVLLRSQQSRPATATGSSP